MPPATPRFPRVGLGAGSLANAGGEEAFQATIRAAWSAGVRYFDTSALYLGGDSERRLGAALRDLPRDGLQLTTKVGRYQDHTGPSIDPQGLRSHYDYSAATTRRSVERSLTRLGVDRLEAVFIHDLDQRICGPRFDELFRAALDGAYPELRRLAEEGLIGAIGVAAMDWRACLQFARAAPVEVVMPAGEHSLLRTAARPLLDHCHRHGIAWIAASPFNSGILATGPQPGAFYDMRPATVAALRQTAALEDICTRHNVPLAAAALQFPLRHPAVSTVVFGAKSPAEFAQTSALADLSLLPPFWQDMEAFLAATAGWEQD